MKKRILALLLILVMIGTQLQTASAGSVVIYHGDSIFGVDYSRLAIRAKFPAKLTLGELQFEGELVHSSDKRKEDINRMVEETMREMGLSGTDLMNSASIMDLVTSANRLQFAEMAKALASFIPAVGDGIGALIDVLVAGKNPLEASFDIVKGQAKDQIQKTIQDTAEYASKRVIRQGSK